MRSQILKAEKFLGTFLRVKFALVPLAVVALALLFNTLNQHSILTEERLKQKTTKKVAARVAGLEVLASSQALPIGGNSIQLRAVLNHTDGTSEDVSDQVVWSLSNESVGTISSDGSFVSSHIEGRTIILAAYDSVMGASTQVEVVQSWPQANGNSNGQASFESSYEVVSQ